MAVERLQSAFSMTIDRIGDMLIERGGRAMSREDQQLFLDARIALTRDRNQLLVEFERRLRRMMEDRIQGKDQKADFSKADATELALVDHLTMDESVVTSNIVRVVENSAHTDLIAFNRGMGHLLEQPDLETAANPLAPATIVEAFADALTGVNAEDRIKFQILKELNQASLVDIAAIYAELNKQLMSSGAMPTCSVRILYARVQISTLRAFVSAWPASSNAITTTAAP